MRDVWLTVRDKWLRREGWVAKICHGKLSGLSLEPEFSNVRIPGIDGIDSWAPYIYKLGL